MGDAPATGRTILNAHAKRLSLPATNAEPLHKTGCQAIAAALPIHGARRRRCFVCVAVSVTDPARFPLYVADLTTTPSLAVEIEEFPQSIYMTGI